MKDWENSKKLWKHSPAGSCSHSISRSPELPLVFLLLDRNTEHVFYFFLWFFIPFCGFGIPVFIPGYDPWSTRFELRSLIEGEKTRSVTYNPLIRDVCFSFQAKVKYPPYPPWAYVIYMVFVLISSICIIYPPLNDCFKRRRAGPAARENLSDSSSSGVSSCELGCIVGRSRSYNISPVSSPCVNGHVNRTVDEDDWEYYDVTTETSNVPGVS